MLHVVHIKQNSCAQVLCVKSQSSVILKIDVKIILHLLATTAIQGSKRSFGESDLTTKCSWSLHINQFEKFRAPSELLLLHKRLGLCPAFQGKVLCQVNIT